MRARAATLWLVGAATAGIPARSLAQSCPPSWELHAADNQVLALLDVHEPGGADALYAGGLFQMIDGVPAARIAHWDGIHWSALDAGVSGQLPNGGGPVVQALAVFDDGTGPKLYAAGAFTSAAGQPAQSIARWDGSSWSALGLGINGAVHALAVYDSGSGRALYAGGVFTTAGTTSAINIAKWNGVAWSRLTNPGTNGDVKTLLAFDDGSGPALYVGGHFTTVGSVAVQNIARWNGSTWSALGDGLNDWVNALAIYDDGGGPRLHAGGQFYRSGTAPMNSVARWTGSVWSQLATGVGGIVDSMAAFDDGSGTVLYIGGGFAGAGVVVSPCIIRWNGAAFSPLGPEPVGTSAGVEALAARVSDGRRLYLGGRFMTAGNQPSPNLAVWAGCTACYANCDGSTVPPLLNVNDFACFLNRFAAGDPYANCDGSTAPPILNVNDFACFQNRFAAGCP